MGETELNRIFSVFTQVLDELMALGFITPRPGATPPGGYEDKPQTSAPLTPGQTERWLAANFDSNARKALNESICLSLKGDVDTAALVNALQDVLQRHDAFRVTFDLEEPVQRLSLERPALDIPLLDFSAAANPIEAFHQYCDTHNTHQFALDKAPLARPAIIRVATDQVFVHMVVSHLIFDGWATPVFLNALAFAYRARVHGATPQWTPAESALTFSTKEQARWESAEAQSSLAYWRELLNNPPAPLQLGDKQAPTPRLYAGSTIHYTFDQSISTVLRKIASDNKATLFQTLFAAVALAIQQRTSRNDFVISVPFASQSLDRHDALIADGVLDLPVRMQLQDSASLPDALSLARARLMDALEHPLATQGSIARALGIPSSGNRPPLTGVYFNLNPRLNVAGFEPLVAEFQEGRKLGLLSEVIFNFYEAPGSLTLDLHYSTEFFSSDAAAQLLKSLIAVIAAIAPQQAVVSTRLPVAGAPLSVTDAQQTENLSKADVERLDRWNNTAVAYESGLRLGDLIRRTVVGQPDAIAVRFEGRSVSYAELDRMAWALAHRLRETGIKPGNLVGVCFDRSVELVVALVGVVYSGAAYVPLDPDYPTQRLTHMCEDAGLRVVVTRASELSRVASAIPSDTQVIQLSSDLLSAPVQSGEIIGSEDDPAYVIFTSGSTGRPKGAINSHKGVVNWLLWMQQTYALSAQDRIMQKTPYSFDVSLREFFWPLLVGAVIVVAKPGGHREANYIVSLVETERVTVIHFVPSMLQIFLDEPDLRRCSSLRLTICSGEALPLIAVDQFFKALPDVRLVNLYGPTEAAVEVTYWECKPNDPRGIVPIGFPVANTHMYVLDEKLKRVPPGAPGDLYIGGVQVGIGYANRPDLTKERFIPNPFISGGKMYKTGDIARWLDDGALEYLGRSDHQVKIRGFRIELGEIEARLMEHNDIARCVVIAREFGGGDTRLVAYYVAKKTEPAAQALKAHLAAQLPEHMLPQHFVALPEIPLLPNGKIDRKALPEPAEPVSPSAAATPPRNPLEAQVAAVMAEALKLKNIGIEDNFFSLGGHSLIAAKVVSQLNKRLGTQLTLRAVFESPTAARLAAAIETLQGKAASVPQRAAIQHQPDQARAPLTLMQERIRFIEEMQPGRVVYNTPSAHRLTGKINLDAFDQAFRAMIERQPALQTAIVETASGYVQELQKIEFSLLPLEDLSKLAQSQREADLANRLEALVAKPFILDRAPLFRARLFKLSDEEHVLFFMTHHIIWDGWSFDVLYAEMSVLYEAFAAGKTPAIAPLSLTYADFAWWHKEWLKSQELKDQITSWKKHFEAAPIPSRVAGDFPRELATGGVGNTEWMHIERDKAEKIRDLAKQTGSTLSMVVLSVYSALISEWLREPCPAIGMPVRGRAVAELEPIMGFFNNMLPVRLPVDRSMTCLEWITKVRTLLVDVFGSQEAPFELLARSINIGKASNATLYQVMFSFQDARARQTHWGDLAHERVRLRQQGATEDVNLWMVEIPTGIEAGIQYNAELFTTATIRALKERFLQMLDALVSNPQQKVIQLLKGSLPQAKPLLRLASARPAAAVDVIANLGIQAADNFSEIALEYGSITITYGQLREHIANAQKSLAEVRADGTALAVVALTSPLAQLVGSYAALAADLQVIAATPAELRSSEFWQGCTQTQKVVALTEASDRSLLPREVIWCDPHTVFADKAFANSGPIVNFDLDRSAASSVAPLNRNLLNKLTAGFTGHVRLLRSDAVIARATTEAAVITFLAATAWLRGARLVLADTRELGNQLHSGELTGLLYADPAAMEIVLRGENARSADMALLVDVAQNSVQMTNRLLESGYTIYNTYRASGLGLPVAMALISQARDAEVVGYALSDDLLSVRDDQGDVAGTGLIGILRVDLGTGIALNEPTLVRERSDGVLQFIGHIERAQGSGIVSSAVRLPALADAPVKQTTAPVAAQSMRPAPAVSPKIPAAQLMISVWKEVLGVSDVTVQDNFFELGGSSLSAMQAAEAVELRLGKRISPRQYVFETLGQLAAAYDGTEGESVQAVLPTAVPVVTAATRERSLAKRFKRLVGLA
jgi:amino acid adenylation domain-containing protein